MTYIPGYCDDAHLAILADLTPEQRAAVKTAFKMWATTAAKSGYAPITEWRNFYAEVDHSALLSRILSGLPPLPEPPPTAHAYPVYP